MGVRGSLVGRSLCASFPRIAAAPFPTRSGSPRLARAAAGPALEAGDGNGLVREQRRGRASAVHPGSRSPWEVGGSPLWMRVFTLLHPQLLQGVQIPAATRAAPRLPCIHITKGTGGARERFQAHLPAPFLLPLPRDATPPRVHPPSFPTPLSPTHRAMFPRKIPQQKPHFQFHFFYLNNRSDSVGTAEESWAGVCKKVAAAWPDWEEAVTGSQWGPGGP